MSLRIHFFFNNSQPRHKYINFSLIAATVSFNFELSPTMTRFGSRRRSNKDSLAQEECVEFGAMSKCKQIVNLDVKLIN